MNIKWIDTGMRYHDTGEPILCPDDYPVVISIGGIDGVLPARPVRLNNLYNAKLKRISLASNEVSETLTATQFLDECEELGI